MSSVLINRNKQKNVRVSITMFDYDQNAPLDVKEIASEKKQGIRIIDISYAGFADERVSAFLIEPPGDGPLAGILFQHGGAQDRTAFLSEAVMLARRGAVSLLVDAPGAREELNYTRPEIDRGMFVRTIINLRRGVDVLAGQADVDAERLGYVGLSFGGYIGGMLAGAERRLKAYVLLAALPSMTELWDSSDLAFAVAMRDSLSLEQLDRYIEVTAPFDVIHHIGKAAPRQFCRLWKELNDTQRNC